MCHRDVIWYCLVLTRLDIIKVVVVVVVVVVVIDDRWFSEAWPVVDSDMFVNTALPVASGE